MDRQFDCRVLLASLQSDLSDEERASLHFVIGKIVSRVDRDDITLRGTLNIIETLFQQEKVTENNLDFLIKAFDAINCKSAVRQLEDFQIKRRSPTSLITRVLQDNDEEDDKCMTATLNSIVSVTNSVISSKQIDKNKSTAAILPSQSLDSNHEVVKHTQPTRSSKFYKSPLTICLFLMHIFSISMLVFCLSVLLPKKLSTPPILLKTDPEVYIIRKDRLCLDIIGGQWINHAQNLSLTYKDYLTSIEFNRLDKLLCSVRFIYSNGKSSNQQLKYHCKENEKNSLSFNSTRQITELVQYFNNNDNKSTYIEGISVITENDPLVQYGLNSENMCKTSGEENSVYWYIEALMTDDYTNAFQFFKYQIRSINDEVYKYVDDNLFSD